MDTAAIPHLPVLIISLLVLFVLSMFFSSAETAFISLNKLRLRFLCEQKHRAALRVEKILQNKQKFLSTILIGNSIVNTAISAVLTAFALHVFGDSGLSIAVASGTVLLLIFGEILPKSIALAYPDTLSFAFSRAVLMVMAVLSPIVAMFSTLTTLLLKLCGVHTAHTTAALTESDLREFFKAQEEGGFIGSDERKLLTNILRYGDVSVRSIMTPRRDIIAIHRDASREEIIALAKQSRFSRFPVYDTNIDSIQGFFYVKDFLFSSQYADENTTCTVNRYVRKPLFVLETLKLAQLEKQFHSERQTMAIVLDEYGGTAGLITVEDVSEQIFGSILDEYDRKESAINDVFLSDDPEKALPPDQPGGLKPSSREELQQQGAVFDAKAVPDVFFIGGNTRLSDLNEQLSLTIESHYSDTIGGYIMEKAGEIPSTGYTVSITPYIFTVVEVKVNRIARIKVQLQQAL